MTLVVTRSHRWLLRRHLLPVTVRWSTPLLTPTARTIPMHGHILIRSQHLTSCFRLTVLPPSTVRLTPWLRLRRLLLTPVVTRSHRLLLRRHLLPVMLRCSTPLLTPTARTIPMPGHILIRSQFLTSCCRLMVLLPSTVRLMLLYL